MAARAAADATPAGRGSAEVGGMTRAGRCYLQTGSIGKSRPRILPGAAGPVRWSANGGLQEPTYPRHQGLHHRLSIQPSRLRDVPDEGALLSEHANAEDRAASMNRHWMSHAAKTDGYKQSRKDRKKVEMLFAHLKRILKLDRLRL